MTHLFVHNTCPLSAIYINLHSLYCFDSIGGTDKDYERVYIILFMKDESRRTVC